MVTKYKYIKCNVESIKHWEGSQDTGLLEYTGTL